MTKKKSKKTKASKPKTVRAAKAGGPKLSFSYKDLVVLYQGEGLTAAKEKATADKLSKDMIRRAAGYLKGLGRGPDFVAWAEGASAPGNRGRTPPLVGEERPYLAQQITVDGKPSRLFLHLPIETLVKKKGSTVKVSFQADRIVLTAA